MSPDISESDRKFANEAIGLFDALVLHPEWTNEDAIAELVATLKVYIRQQQPYRKGWEDAMAASAQTCFDRGRAAWLAGQDTRLALVVADRQLAIAWELEDVRKAIRSIPAPEGEKR